MMIVNIPRSSLEVAVGGAPALAALRVALAAVVLAVVTALSCVVWMDSLYLRVRTWYANALRNMHQYNVRPSRQRVEINNA